MIKDKLIDLVKDATGNRYRDRTVGIWLELAFGTVIGQLFKNDPAQYDLYTKSYVVPVVQQKPRPYSVLPVRIIETSDMANGVRNIFSTEDDDLDFVPMPLNGFSFYNAVKLDDVTDSVGYSVKGGIVEYWNMSSAVTSVRMELVRAFSEWDGSEDIPLPSGTENIIVSQAIQMITSQKPETNIYKTKQ